MSYKDQWFANFERRLNELEDAGDANAYDHAAEEAHEITADQIADSADMARLIAKERFR